MVSQSRGGIRDWLLNTWSTFDLGFAFEAEDGLHQRSATSRFLWIFFFSVMPL